MAGLRLLVFRAEASKEQKTLEMKSSRAKLCGLWLGRSFFLEMTISAFPSVLLLISGHLSYCVWRDLAFTLPVLFVFFLLLALLQMSLAPVVDGSFLPLSMGHQEALTQTALWRKRATSTPCQRLKVTKMSSAQRYGWHMARTNTTHSPWVLTFHLAPLDFI